MYAYEACKEESEEEKQSGWILAIELAAIKNYRKPLLSLMPAAEDMSMYEIFSLSIRGRGIGLAGRELGRRLCQGCQGFLFRGSYQRFRTPSPVVSLRRLTWVSSQRIFSVPPVLKSPPDRTLWRKMPRYQLTRLAPFR